MKPCQYVIDEITPFNLEKVILHLMTPEIQDGRHLKWQSNSVRMVKHIFQGRNQKSVRNFEFLTLWTQMGTRQLIMVPQWSNFYQVLPRPMSKKRHLEILHSMTPRIQDGRQCKLERAKNAKLTPKWTNVRPVANLHC